MNSLPIGFFDTGVGGLSVLQAAKKLLPNEDFIYLADFKNAPYGSKREEEILSLTTEHVAKLVDMGIKALVIACNTATSAAAHVLRKAHDFPIIGLEPAIKPAVEQSHGKPIAVMATPATLRLKKYKKLISQYETKSIYEVPCPGLSRLIETSGPGSKDIQHYLYEVLGNFANEVCSVVIGCTHFSFLAQDIREILHGVSILDGREGAARQLQRILKESKLENHEGGEIRFLSTDDDVACYNLLDTFMKRKI